LTKGPISQLRASRTAATGLSDAALSLEGAASGKGLGHDFLRHVERTAVILHLIDAYDNDIQKSYQTIRDELKEYDVSLATRPEIVALTKIEGLDPDIIEDELSQLKPLLLPSTQVFAVSSQSGQGLKELLYALQATVKKVRSVKAPKPKKPAVPVITLDNEDDAWQVEKTGKIFSVSGIRIERFAKRTDFDNEESVQRLRTIMRKVGITHELIRQGILAGDTIVIGTQRMTY